MGQSWGFEVQAALSAILVVGVDTKSHTSVFPQIKMPLPIQQLNIPKSRFDFRPAPVQEPSKARATRAT